MLPVQADPGFDFTIGLMTLLALIGYAIIGGLIAWHAKNNDVARPEVWGGTVFVAMLLGTLFVDRQILGAIVAGGFVMVFYVLITRD